MGRAVLQACLPWLALLGISLLLACLLVRMSQSRVRFSRLWSLHRDESGGVQTLAFVLALPPFVWVMELIVQVSQLMIATIVVHYAAYAAARSAIVWIPASIPASMPGEGANCISWYSPDPSDQSIPVYVFGSLYNAPNDGGVTYKVREDESSEKYKKIKLAAVLACMPISPSANPASANRDTAMSLPGDARPVAKAVYDAYASLVSDSAGNSKIATRLDNKLAYAWQNTEVTIRFYHKNDDPPLVADHGYVQAGPDCPYNLPDGITPDSASEFLHNELGWRDTITVTVTHNFALLPGPAYRLAKFMPGATGEDKVSESLQKYRKGDVYVWPLTASATLGNEGEKSLVPYEYQTY